MDKHVAEVTLLESFDLGKNTKKSAGIAIKVFDKASGKRGYAAWHDQYWTRFICVVGRKRQNRERGWNDAQTNPSIALVGLRKSHEETGRQ